jgi:hypothetical protein
MGLTTTTAAAILAFNALMASAQSGWSCDCDGLFAPVWKDCKKVQSFPVRSSLTDGNR